MLSPLPPNWTATDFDTWFAPISRSATELRDEWVLARTPFELLVVTKEYLATGATISPLPLAWSTKEYNDWINALLAEATAAYNGFIISSTPPPLQSAIKERINYQQPPPTNDLINGGNSGLPGTPGVPGTLPPGSTLTRASATGTYWEGSNYVSNSSMVGGAAPPGWNISGTGNGVTRTLIGTGTEDGIPYTEIRYAGTPNLTSSIFISPVNSNVVPALAGQAWTAAMYVRLTAGSLTNTTHRFRVAENNAAGTSVQVTNMSPAPTPAGAALRTQRYSVTRTFTDATTVFAGSSYIIDYTLNNPIDITLRIGLPTLTKQVGANQISNPAATGAVPGLYTGGTTGAQFPTNWIGSPTFAGLNVIVVGSGVEDGLSYVDVQWQGSDFGIGGTVIFHDTPYITAAPGQAWAVSAYVRLVGGSLNNVDYVRMRATFSGTTGTGTYAQFVPTNAPLKSQLQRVVGVTNATSTSITPVCEAKFVTSAPVNLTLRFAFPQAVPDAFAPQLYTANTDVPRFTVNPGSGLAEGLLDEPAATNLIRNSIAEGAGAGLNPTFWGTTGTTANVTRTIIGGGIEDGIPYFEIQYAGTPNASGTMFINFEGASTQVPALVGQTWTASVYLKLAAGQTSNTVIALRMTEANSGGTGIGTSNTTVVPTNSPLRIQRVRATRTFDQAATAFAIAGVTIAYTNAKALNITLRIGLPQLVQAPAATSAIFTNNAAVTRETDIFNMQTPNGTSDMVVTRASGATTYPGQVITTGKWLVPTDPSPVRTVAANVVAAAMPTYGFMAGTLPAGVTLNRPTTGWNFGATNQIRNPTASGAVAGTPGTLPTNWVLTNGTSLTSSVVGTGVEDGIPYVDINWAGTVSGFTTLAIQGEASAFINALDGQTWTGSWYVRLVAGTIPASSNLQHQLNGANSSGSSVGTIVFADLKLTAAPLASQRSTLTRINNNASTAKVKDVLSLLFGLPATGVNFTLRFAVPYLAQGPVALVSAASDVPRFSVNPSTNNLEGLLNEPPALCSLINASGLGATGTTTPPTGWATSGNLASLTRTYTQVVEDGIPAVDIKITGTPNNTAGAYGTASMFFGAATEVAALPGQTWTGSLFCRLSTGTLAPPNTTQWVEFFVREANAAGGLLPDLDTLQLTPTSAPLRTQRTDVTHKVVNAAAAMLRPYLLFVYTGGVPVDFTVRVFPQLVKAPAATSPIITTNAAVTRGSDVLVCQIPNPVPGFWDITVKRASGTTVVSGVDLTSGVGTSYEVPTDPSPVQSVKFTLS